MATTRGEDVNTGWLRGSLPSWLIAGMMALSIFGATRWFNDLEAERKQFSMTLSTHQTSIAIVEGKITVLERGQDLVLQELRGIRQELSQTQARNRNQK